MGLLTKGTWDMATSDSQNPAEKITLRLRRIFADVFGVEQASVNEGTSTQTLAAWDSISHIGLMLAVEAEFVVQFEPGEIGQLNSFQAIATRLAAAR